MADTPISASQRLVMAHMLHGLKSQIDGIGTQIDALILSLQEPEQDDNGECQHPPDRRLDLSTMGRSRWRCQDCGFESDEPLKRE